MKETDITYQYQDDNLTIKALMKIKLLKRYKADKFTFEVLWLQRNHEQPERSIEINDLKEG